MNNWRIVFVGFIVFYALIFAGICRAYFNIKYQYWLRKKGGEV